MKPAGAHVLIRLLFYSAGNKVKAGKSFVFWGLDKEFQSVAVVGLGKRSKPRDEIELVSEERESVRVAAAGRSWSL
jgi:hypothetical protein